MPVYLDNNASTHLDASVLVAMLPYLSGPHANPSSVHRYGRMARDAVETARHQVARLINASPQDLVWVSGGTEANNLAVKGVTGEGRLLYGATDHPAVMEAAISIGGEAIAVDTNGIVRWSLFEAQLQNAPVRLVSLMHANNETGAIQDVARAAELAHAANALMHHGGPQERGLRGGTENVAGIVGFGAAAELALQALPQRQAHVLKLRAQLEAGLKTIPQLVIFSERVERLPNTVQFGVPARDGETLLIELDKRGMAVSSGSACASGSREPSHVLLAMGVEPALAKSAIRVSLGKNNTAAEVEQFLTALREVLA